MSEQEIIQILAERDGWEAVCECGDTIGFHHMGGNEHTFTPVDDRPDYLNSHDAIRGVILKLTDEEFHKLAQLLDDRDGSYDFEICADVVRYFLTLPTSTLAPMVAMAIKESK